MSKIFSAPSISPFSFDLLITPKRMAPRQHDRRPIFEKKLTFFFPLRATLNWKILYWGPDHEGATALLKKTKRVPEIFAWFTRALIVLLYEKRGQFWRRRYLKKIVYVIVAVATLRQICALSNEKKNRERFDLIYKIYVARTYSYTEYPSEFLLCLWYYVYLWKYEWCASQVNKWTINDFSIFVIAILPLLHKVNLHHINYTWILIRTIKIISKYKENIICGLVHSFYNAKHKQTARCRRRP